MNIHDNFYKYFEGLDKETVDKAFYKLSRTSQKQILFTWNPDKLQKENTSSAKRCIKLMNKELYKIDIREKIKCKDLELIQSKVNDLDSKRRESLLNEYSILGFKELKTSLTLEDKRINFSTIDKIKYSLENNTKLNKRKDYLRNYDNYISLFKKYPLDTEEDVIRVVKTLSTSRQALLYKKYGKDLKNTGALVSDEENNMINMTITRIIKRYLNGIRNNKYSFYKFTDLFDESCKERIHLLNKNDLNRIHYVFGEDLNKEFISKDKNFINKHIYFVLNNEYKKDLKPYISIIDLLINEKKDNETIDEFINRIKFCISCLGQKSRRLIYEKYGDDLLNTSNKHLTRYDDILVNSGVIPRLKELLRDSNKCYYISLKEVFKDDYFYIDSFINKLSKDELELLKKKYGEYLDSKSIRFSLTTEENIMCNSIIRKLLRLIIEHKASKGGLLVKDYNEIIKLTKTEEYLSLCEMYDKNVSLAIMLKIHKKELSNEQIYTITKVKPLTFLYLSIHYLQSKKLTLK